MSADLWPDLSPPYATIVADPPGGTTWPRASPPADGHDRVGRLLVTTSHATNGWQPTGAPVEQPGGGDEW